MKQNENELEDNDLEFESNYNGDNVCIDSSIWYN